MTPTHRRLAALPAGVATGVGSLPHDDAGAALDVAIGVTSRLPFAPQLPGRHAGEGMLAQWLGALPEVEVAPDGSFGLTGGPAGEPRPVLTADLHSGYLGLIERLRGSPPAVVKLQATGPLTLGMALADAGMPGDAAFGRAAELVVAWCEALVGAFERSLPGATPLLFLDEPSLVAWRTDDPPLAREDAVDLLSGVLASVPAPTGVHVCGEGDRRMAFEAGPDVVGFPVSPSVVDDGVPASRFLDAGGWIAWGAVPTDRPVGEQADHWWNELVALWCELTRGGCDPAVLRTQALVTPACGLAGHTEAQAERILDHCVEIGERVREQAIATRLSVGA